MFKDLLKITRSYRNFDRSYPLSDEFLTELVELCRFTPSTANRQALKFVAANDEAVCSRIFKTLGWAGYIKENKPPFLGNEPMGYVLICYDTEISPELEVDVGICAQTIVLGAMDKGIGACMLGSFDKSKMSEIFALPEHIKPRLIVALGKPKESVEIVDCADGDIKYYRKNGIHYVPKRTLSEIFLGIKR